MSRTRRHRDGVPGISPQTGRPQWAGRVSRRLIAELYRGDAQGIVDGELIDEVGYALLARCESILVATQAGRGEATCPVCGAAIPHEPGATQTLTCPDCGWSLPWAEYHASVHGKGLHAGGIEAFLREFVEKYPRAPTPRHRMILIDQLIHRYHWEMVNHPGRPGGSNLIGGTVVEVVALLDSLSYSDQSTPGLRETHNRWRKQGRRTLRRLDKGGALARAAAELRAQLGGGVAARAAEGPATNNAGAAGAGRGAPEGA
ncbi:MAG: hypothetical protein AB1505_05470 [Candidatus Latescibacterota bacterium]